MGTGCRHRLGGIEGGQGYFARPPHVGGRTDPDGVAGCAWLGCFGQLLAGGLPRGRVEDVFSAVEHNRDQRVLGFGAESARAAIPPAPRLPGRRNPQRRDALQRTARLRASGGGRGLWPGARNWAGTYFRRRLSCTTHSTLSHLQLPHGAPSTTSQRTLRARHETQARAARRLVILGGPLGSDCEALRFLPVVGDRPAASGSTGDFMAAGVSALTEAASAVAAGDSAAGDSAVAVMMGARAVGVGTWSSCCCCSGERGPATSAGTTLSVAAMLRF